MTEICKKSKSWCSSSAVPLFEIRESIHNTDYFKGYNLKKGTRTQDQDPKNQDLKNQKHENQNPKFITPIIPSTGTSEIRTLKTKIQVHYSHNV